MSGHSKWHSIKHKKGAADAKRGKIFTRHANLISIAAHSGGDPEMNASLRLAIDNAKADNVPNANVERAIKRGTGELKDAAQIEEITYEGYGPCGTAVIVECLTDNRNRSVTNIRTIFSKNGGNLGTSGSVMWMFDRKGVIHLAPSSMSAENIELAAIDAGADDFENEEGAVTIYTKPNELHAVSEKLKAAGIIVEKAQLMLIPNNTVTLESEEDAKKVMEFIDALEEDEDVSNVSSNFDISDEVMKKLSE